MESVRVDERRKSPDSRGGRSVTKMKLLDETRTELHKVQGAEPFQHLLTRVGTPHEAPDVVSSASIPLCKAVLFYA